MAFSLSKRSERALIGVHPDLKRVVWAAIYISTMDFVVIEGVRTLEMQRQYVASGASRTMKSRHLTGHAVDLAPFLGTIRWEEALFDPIAAAMKVSAKTLGAPIQWGFDLWGWDRPHFQLPWKQYPG
jgi:peptidoglycan L-alanyl-D-glutamate endopeptidase CwlK